MAGGLSGSHASGQFDLKALQSSWGRGGVGSAYRKILIGCGTEKTLEARIVRKGMAPDKAGKELAVMESRRSDLAILTAIRKRVRYFPTVRCWEERVLLRKYSAEIVAVWGKEKNRSP